MSTKIGFIGQGEKWDGTHFTTRVLLVLPSKTMSRRPCQQLCEFMEQSSDKVYCSCTNVLELRSCPLNTSKLLFKTLTCSSKEGLDLVISQNL